MDKDTKGIDLVSETRVLSVVFFSSFWVFIQCTTRGPRIKKNTVEESRDCPKNKANNVY